MQAISTNVAQMYLLLIFLKNVGVYAQIVEIC